jgi:hypothetical protein
MMNEPTPAGGADNIFETANDRFKRSFGVTFWG